MGPTAVTTSHDARVSSASITLLDGTKEPLNIPEEMLFDSVITTEAEVLQCPPATR
ncbi:hypothetical protein PHET_05479 [Paragonimus heterotremus]|uniref:Uncharacterized protein n=1 Tax=Paragonimus heterotremus TaxID=100268 RepID=A0A8J4TGJ4_9TREM|nr:hypothetical protein PHET_05479 [Paragonimus heterotremus]